MKIKSGFVLRKVADTYIVVAIGGEAKAANVMITLNETGALLWEKLSAEASREALCDAMLEVYDIDRETALSDVDAFIAKLEKENLLDK